MSAIKRDVVKQQWEDTEFPLVCETCLGDNPYVRMTKEPHGKKCQICETPFTVFAWQAGTKGRIKRVEICRSCAQAKNVCQVCIYDLQYGLPVKVRDKILREAGASAAGGAMTAVPQSRANRSWFTAQQQRALDQGQNIAANDDASIAAHAKLSEMARMEPRYERNLPKLCSFFAQGECNRGANCPFRHEMPRDRNDPMSKQSTKDRFYGSSDPVANKILGRRARYEDKQQKELESEEGGYEKARATLYLRFKGDEPYPAIDESDLRDILYAYGEIVSVRVHAEKGQAFVEYTTPEATELAISTLSTSKQELKGRPLFVAWARAPKRGDEGGSTSAAGPDRGARHDSTMSATTVRPLAPPGASSSSKSSPSNRAIPKFAVKPPPQVTAAASARRQRSGISTSVPRPGGGPIRGAGVSAARAKQHQPYYPSSNPNRLGTNGSNTDN
mmetsp:Transcript_13915/g.30401  ORF Transcript_13915/g.30401 Transcript_13915/m.30401 type:complete len:445 (+) Transcript_13915:74-1408(+)